MNIVALLDKLAADLTTDDRQVAREPEGLAFQGQLFAKLHQEGMAFRLGADSPAREAALEREAARGRDAGWVYSPASDVGQWPTLAEQALAAVYRP
ncbi:hypothetical protein [Gephyromycinifex aptenodytis]|uniref:hypothetical protein n=1 Tax=Gephyromycinifex aptenodytis TaxID=2716227 RepID=UPI001446DC41|nr:hypothetical protein [Gephyromycinifex aptenodytis]